MSPETRRTAGHHDVLGETYAKFEFFQRGWNPYGKFVDQDRVDLILRKTVDGEPRYREAQVIYGRLTRTGAGWEHRLFDVTAWRFFREDEFEQAGGGLFVAYVLSEDEGYHGDIFVFPVHQLVELIRSAPRVGDKRRVYFSRTRDEPKRWMLRRQNTFDRISADSCTDITPFRRAFALLDAGV